jgi:lysophospholipase L1-like esterase
LRTRSKLLLALLSAVVALEVGLRVADGRAGRTVDDYLPEPSAARLYEPHPFIGYVLRPGAKRDRKGYAWNVNSLGMRGPERSAHKPPGVYRILCLGGSTTFGTASTSDETTYPAQLERVLNESPPPGVTYEVWNCGVSGYTTAEDLVNLALRLLAYEPDAILLYEGGNDARPVVSSGFKSDYTHIRRPWTETELSAVEGFLVRHWRTYAWLTRDVRVDQTLTQRLYVPNLEELRLPPGDPINEEGIATYLRNLRSIIAVAREAGVEPVLSTFATCTSKNAPGDADIVRVVERMNAEVRALCAGMSVGCIEVDDVLSEREGMFDDVMHFNDKGCRAHALVVRDGAREQGLFLPR